MYFAITGIVFFAAFAMLVREGIWNNLLTMMMILIGGMIAFGYFQPITRSLDSKTGGSYTYLLDFLVIWFLFAITVGLLKVFGKMLSPKKVKFVEGFDLYGGIAIAVFTAYLITGMMLASMHSAPLVHNLFDNRFVMGETRKEVESSIASTSVIMRPDLAWLGLMENILQGSSIGGSNFSASRYVHSYAEHRKTFGTFNSYLVDRK